MLIVPGVYKESRKINNFLNVDMYLQFTYSKLVAILLFTFSVEYALDFPFAETLNLTKIEHIYDNFLENMSFLSLFSISNGFCFFSMI